VLHKDNHMTAVRRPQANQKASPNSFDRRTLLQTAGVSVATACVGRAIAQQPKSGESGVRVLNPLGRVPLSFIIDDSTCLVNMAYFAMPQFAQAMPERKEYKQPWREWPREIPDSFVREFGEWCAEHGVKGKYSIVPYPACVGGLDRILPGWSHRDLQDSLKLVRDLMVPNWDIHPEMVTHTRVIDLKTGRPMKEANAATMENSYPQSDKSVDELASYMAYGLQILKNCGLPCEGITTPGGFGNRVKKKLPIAVHQAVRDVFGAELPHYFKYVVTGADESPQPKLEHIGDTKDVSQLTINVPAGTGDWFGGWEGNRKSEGYRYCNEDATEGRMVDLIERGEPAVLLCHWPGMYCNGDKFGFEDFKKIVLALAGRYREKTVWMKVSEIGRYWAAKELTTIQRESDETISINAPLSCGRFTFEITGWTPKSKLLLSQREEKKELRRVSNAANLKDDSYVVDGTKTIFCIDVPSGDSVLI